MYVNLENPKSNTKLNTSNVHVTNGLICNWTRQSVGRCDSRFQLFSQSSLCVSGYTYVYVFNDMIIR